MSSLNRVILIGNLGRDPEVKTLQDGKLIANMSIATSERWKGRDGEKRERTEWHRIVVWNEKLAEIVQKHLRKGAKACIEGQLQTRKWTDESGNERYTTEVVIPRFGGSLTMLGGGDRGEQGQASHDTAPAGKSAPATTAMGELDDDIPF